jgi:hypothetical protein
MYCILADHLTVVLILLFLACGMADSLQSIEVKGNKQYWFVENAIVADIILRCMH